MIPAHEVTAAVLARLRSVHPAVYDLVAPSGAAAPYGVLEYPPGGISDGDIDQPEWDLIWHGRIRAVGADSAAPSRIDGAREQAQRVAYRLTTALLDRTVPLSGATWIVAAREFVADGGIDHQGPVVNVVVDVDLWVVPA